MLQRRVYFLVLFFSLFLGNLSPSYAQPSNGPGAPPTLKSILKESSQFISEGHPESAIRQLEAAADRGLHHPDLSFNRGLAYQRRAQSADFHQGDWGQAIAGFAETLQLRPHDAEAEKAILGSQLQVAKKSKNDPLASNAASLGLIERALLALNPFYLLLGAALGSLVFSLGQVVRWSNDEHKRLIGGLTLAIGALVLVTSAGLAGARALVFSDTQLAITISPKTPLLDGYGRSIEGTQPLTEGTILHVGAADDAWLPLAGFGEKKQVGAATVRQVPLANP